MATELPAELAVEGRATVRPAAISCDAAAPDATARGEPPAWLLLATGVALLAAGRLARNR